MRRSTGEKTTNLSSCTAVPPRPSPSPSPLRSGANGQGSPPTGGTFSLLLRPRWLLSSIVVEDRKRGGGGEDGIRKKGQCRRWGEEEERSDSEGRGRRRRRGSATGIGGGGVATMRRQESEGGDRSDTGATTMGRSQDWTKGRRLGDECRQLLSCNERVAIRAMNHMRPYYSQPNPSVYQQAHAVVWHPQMIANKLYTPSTICHCFRPCRLRPRSIRNRRGESGEAIRRATAVEVVKGERAERRCGGRRLPAAKVSSSRRHPESCDSRRRGEAESGADLGRAWRMARRGCTGEGDEGRRRQLFGKRRRRRRLETAAAGEVTG
uniref:Uncharacterized protein n=1 Tax=Oryza glumipatula TaxID=40148 RepID=A0A0D9ZBE1_9ORYZ